MKGCTRCGRWHSDAEKMAGRKLTCTETKQFWAGIRQEHMRRKGHLAQITTDDNGDWICIKCGDHLM